MASLPAILASSRNSESHFAYGIIPMEPIMVAAKAVGVQHCHVEQDQSADPLASIRQSMDYLKKL